MWTSSDFPRGNCGQWGTSLVTPTKTYFPAKGWYVFFIYIKCDLYDIGKQQQMAHMDFAVNDLEKAVQYAMHCGAVVADKQFSDSWRVMLDPAGHPFCLCQMKSLIESGRFALL